MRLTAKVLVAACTLPLLACWVFEVAESFGASLFPDIRAQANAVSRERRQRDEFIFRVSWIEGQLAESRMSLREAIPLLETTAAECWPAFLTYAPMINAPGNLRTKLACNLLLQFRHKVSPCTSERLLELEREYQAIAAEEQEGVKTQQLPTGS